MAGGAPDGAAGAPSSGAAGRPALHSAPTSAKMAADGSVEAKESQPELQVSRCAVEPFHLLHRDALRASASLASSHGIYIVECVQDQQALRPAMGSREMASEAALARRLTSRRLLLREHGVPGTRWRCRCGPSAASLTGV